MVIVVPCETMWSVVIPCETMWSVVLPCETMWPFMLLGRQTAELMPRVPSITELLLLQLLLVGDAGGGPRGVFVRRLWLRRVARQVFSP